MSSNTSKPLIENESSPPRCNIVSCCKKDVIHGVIPVERSALLQKIVLDDTAPPPSWLQKLLCDCNSAQRKLTVSGIQDVTEISNLAGLLLQNELCNSFLIVEGSLTNCIEDSYSPSVGESVLSYFHKAL